MSKAGPADTRHGGLGNVLSGLAVALGCVLFLGGFIWAAVLYQPYTVPTDSMDPTVKAGDRVLAERIGGDEVHRGDVVVFQDSVWGTVPIVKRVVGVGGDKIACCTRQGQVSVDGKPLHETYLKGRGPSSQTPFSTKVKQGSLFLLGDHRLSSEDSRAHMDDNDHGAVPRSAVRARVDAVAWPASGVGMLSRPATFAALPGGTSQPGPLESQTVAVIAGAVLILGGAAYGPIARRAGRGARR